MIDVQEQMYEKAGQLLGLPTKEVERLWHCYCRVLKRQIVDNKDQMEAFPIVNIGKVCFSTWARKLYFKDEDKGNQADV